MSVANTVDLDHTLSPPSGCDVNAVEKNDGGTPTVKVAFGIPRMVGDSGSGGTGGAVTPPGAGDAAAGKYLKADGTWDVPPGGASPNFADGEVVSGSGTAFTLAHPPSPADSLILVQRLPSFGGIVLFKRVGSPLVGDFDISGANITTVNSLSAGDLRAWYRY